MSELLVATAALRRASKSLTQAAADWAAAGSDLNGAKLGADDLGYLGRVANIPSKYNAVVDGVWQQLDSGRNVLALSAVNLRMTANEYDHAEDKNLTLMPKHG
ncbi:hypothetical protein [Actinomadura sp. NTSP31]|uniref:hypothetical protein n=1 Tax=Actinomadura sp. NTSP31 TaxID=1735447 RepID=UPI0035C1AC8C